MQNTVSRLLVPMPHALLLRMLTLLALGPLTVSEGHLQSWQLLCNCLPGKCGRWRKEALEAQRPPPLTRPCHAVAPADLRLSAPAAASGLGAVTELLPTRFVILG